MRRAMRILGGEFVLGRDIEEALKRGAERTRRSASVRSTCSAKARARSRRAALFRRVRRTRSTGSGRLRRIVGARHEVSAISVKLSALHPRYDLSSATGWSRAVSAVAANSPDAPRRWNVGMSIDAEEADRLELSLDLYEGWRARPSSPVGTVSGSSCRRTANVRSPVIDWFGAIARDTGRRFTVRLVKGAYWDSGNQTRAGKRPRRTSRCSRTRPRPTCLPRVRGRCSGAPDASTRSSRRTMRIRSPRCSELAPAGADCRIPAPARHGRVVVPRGERNSSRTSRRCACMRPSADTAICSPTSCVVCSKTAPTLVRESFSGCGHAVARRRARSGHAGRAWRRIDIREFACRRRCMVRSGAIPRDRSRNRRVAVERLTAAIATQSGSSVEARPSTGRTAPARSIDVRNPADRRDAVGRVRYATSADVDAARSTRPRAQPDWDAARRGGPREDPRRPVGAHRDAARSVRRTAGARRRQNDRGFDLGSARSGRLLPLLRAARARQFAAPGALPGPTGESNELSPARSRRVRVHQPVELSACDFPGPDHGGARRRQRRRRQTGGTDAADRGARDRTCLHDAGVPPEALQFCCRRRGARSASRAPAIRRSRALHSPAPPTTALTINRALAARDGAILPLIAETGGMNAMFVDSTALLEQVIDDVMRSAFGSAGQRCSALRLLLLQDDVADTCDRDDSGRDGRAADRRPGGISTDVGP